MHLWKDKLSGVQSLLQLYKLRPVRAVPDSWKSARHKQCNGTAQPSSPLTADIPEHDSWLAAKPAQALNEVPAVFLPALDNIESAARECHFMPTYTCITHPASAYVGKRSGQEGC